MRAVRWPFALFLLVFGLLLGCTTVPRSAEGGADLASAGMPGGRLRMRLPDGFVRPTRAPLLVDLQHGIAVSVVEGTAPSTKDGDDMVAGLMKTDDLGDVVARKIHRADAEGVIVTGTDANGKRVTRVVLRSGAAVGCVLLLYPPEATGIVAPILSSIWLDAKATLDPGRLSGLSIGAAEGMHVIDVLTPPIMLWETNAKPPLPPGSPTLAFVVVPAPTKDHVKGVVAGLLEEGHVDRESLQTKELVIDDAPAVEITGNGVDDGMPVKFFAVLLEDPGSVIAVFGHYTRAEDLERFRKIVGGTRRLAGMLGAVRLP